MRRSAILVLVALSSLLVIERAEAAARFSVSPHTAKAAGRVTVRATHLQSHATYTVLFVPDKNHRLQRLMGVQTSTSRGTLAGSFLLPAVPYCGSATVYLIGAKSVVAHASIKVVGCNPSGASPPPPPKR